MRTCVPTNQLATWRARQKKTLKTTQVAATQVVEKVVAEQAGFLARFVQLAVNTVRARRHHARLEDYGHDDDN